MTLTFIADPAGERQSDEDHVVPVYGGPDVLPDSAGISATADFPAPRRGFLRRVLSALFSPLRNRRRLLPPRDDHLMRDIGLSERELPREYWEYWWHHY
ncbi:hypothetical protein [Mesorhizobium sp. WSM3224]|uniref:hypothetical protein n=1 Tax=Mesorhizobium sp. WSM3224 TaxID=1040986 RepID=UPI0004054095|nr:hypothetical protein [Mesorhizobium sp. WSM3224]